MGHAERSYYIFKNFAKFTGKHLCWSHFLVKLQVLRPATSFRRDSSTGISLRILCNFSKNLNTELLLVTAPANSSLPTRVLSIDHSFFLFSFIFLLLFIDNCNYGSLFRMLLRQYASAIICRCTLEKMQISVSRSLGNFWVPRQISKASQELDWKM